MVEWFDWFVYASFATYFAGAFFPSGNPTAQLMNTAGIFAVGFFMRPVGGWLLGRVGDRKGRKAALTLTVTLMSASAVLIAVAPTYAVAGYGGALVLLVARLLQGLSVGGEYAASATYLTEASDPKRRGFASSFQYVSMTAGQIVGLGLQIVLQRTMSDDALHSYGWRIPFVVGALGAAVVFYLRRNMLETEVYEEDTSHAGGARHPARAVAAPAGGVPGHRPHHGRHGGLLHVHHLPHQVPVQLGGPVQGDRDPGLLHRADRLRLPPAARGRPLRPDRPPPAADHLRRRLHLPDRADHDAAPARRRLLAGPRPRPLALVVVTGYTSINACVKAELFPTGVRALGVALPYAIANALFGGTAEYVALWFKKGGAESGFYWYVAACAAVSLVVYVTMRETKDLDLARVKARDDSRVTTAS